MLRWVTGVLLIILGIGFLVQVFGIVPGFDMVTLLQVWWPLLLVLIGLIPLANKTSHPAMAVLTIAVGVLLIVKALHPELAHIFWPVIGAAVLLALGLRLLLKVPEKDAVARAAQWAEQRTVSAELPRDKVDVNISFGAGKYTNASQQFAGGSIDVSFGSVQLDLRSAKLAESGATLDITAKFSGVEIIIPTDWTLEISGQAAFGGWENHTENFPPANKEDKHVLHIRCTPTFGGVEIRNEKGQVKCGSNRVGG